MMCTKAKFLFKVYPLGFNAYIWLNQNNFMFKSSASVNSLTVLCEKCMQKEATTELVLTNNSLVYTCDSC